MPRRIITLPEVFQKLLPLIVIGCVRLGVSAEVRYDTLPRGDMLLYDLILADGHEVNRNLKDLRVMVRAVGDTVVSVNLQGTEIRVWEIRVNLRIEGNRLFGSFHVWEDKSTYPVELDVTEVDRTLAGAFVARKSRAISRKTGILVEGNSDLSGPAGGMKRTENELGEQLRVNPSVGWPSWLGPNNSFSVHDPDVEVLDDWRKAKLVWRTEFVNPPEHGSCRYGAHWHVPPAGSGATPVIGKGVLYQFHSIPVGDDIISCFQSHIEEGHGNKTPEHYQSFFENLDMTEKEIWAAYRIKTDECVMAIDAATGRTLWKTCFPHSGLNLFDHKAALTNHTPVLAEDRIIVMGSLGVLRCLDVSDGTLLWSRNIPQFHEGMTKQLADALEDHSIPYLSRSFAHSLTHAEGVVVAPTGRGGCGLAGFDINSGTLLWTVDDVLGGSASPVVWKHNGKAYFIAGNDKGLITAVEAEEGTVPWTVQDGETNKYQNVLEGDFLVARAGVYRLSLSGAEKMFDIPCDPGTRGVGAILNGIAYLHCPNSVRAIELETGILLDSVESIRSVGEAFHLAAYNTFIADQSSSHGKTEPAVFRIDNGNIEPKGLWLPPHPHATSYEVPFSLPLVDGRIYIRGLDGIYCYDLRKNSSYELPSRPNHQVSVRPSLKVSGVPSLPEVSMTSRLITLRHGGSSNASFEVSIHDARGVRVQTFTVSSGTKRIDREGTFVPGLYFAEISSGGVTARKSLLCLQ